MQWLPVFVAISFGLTACARHNGTVSAPYVPLADVEAVYGRLITTGNHPTPHQNGTGERIGLFQDAAGTVWGLPLVIANGGSVLACAPPTLREGKVTDTYPAGTTVIGSMNEPTGWRGGTGGLELLLRDAQGNIHWQSIRGAQVTGEPACWSPASRGPQQRLRYYRLAPK